MISFYDKLVDNFNNYEEITNLLISFDHMLELLHNNGLCIYDFNPKKIILYNDKFTFQSFNGLLNDIGVSPNSKEANIWQLSKIGLMAYNNSIVDGSITDDWNKYIQSNLKSMNEHGNIPEEIYEYYEEVFLNIHYEYMNNYLKNKELEKNGQENSIVMKKSLSTAVGRAYAKEENNAYINILFIPSILTLVYLIGLFIYIFVIK